MPKEHYQDHYLNIPLQQGIVLRRNGGVISTNVPHVVAHHSPDGYEFGYGGSGPADLALNIVENVLRLINYKGPLSEKLWDGYRVFQLAWRVHQDFKWDFIGGLSSAPGEYIIPWERVVVWVEQRVIAEQPPSDGSEYV